MTFPRNLLFVIAVALNAVCGPIQFPTDSEGFIGSKACATCHGEIAKNYATTAMAQASGRVSELRLPSGKVFAAKAGVTYSISWKTDTPQLRFRKLMPDGSVIEGAKNLSYYVGSGAHARAFIFEEQGQPFQAPIGYYGEARGWDLAPGYEKKSSVSLGRKVETACLTCHASGLKLRPSELFQEGAVSCERCHGPGGRHVIAVQSGRATSSPDIINPLHLEPESRDSICAQCHLIGETRVVKAGRSEHTFRAGDRLGEHVVPFVWSSPEQTEFKVIGHFEGLWQSKCKRLSGARLSCLTCHDPHTKVPVNEKSAYYRQRCLGCHQQSSCKATVTAKNRKGDSCIGCHMGIRPSTDGQHTAFTDHAIHRSAERRDLTTPSTELIAFWPATATARDYALAYAQEAWLRGDAATARRAHEKLQAVWSLAPNDGAVAAELGYTNDVGGDAGKAQALYEQALKADSENLLALTNLATHLAQAGRVNEAVGLWKKALAINPGSQVPGLNLAMVEEAEGQRGAALETVRQVLSLNPDSERALYLLRKFAGLP